MGSGAGVSATCNRQRPRLAEHAAGSRNLQSNGHAQYAGHPEYTCGYAIDPRHHEFRTAHSNSWLRYRHPLAGRDTQFHHESARLDDDHSRRSHTGHKASKQHAALHPDQQRFCHNARHDSESIRCESVDFPGTAWNIVESAEHDAWHNHTRKHDTLRKF